SMSQAVHTYTLLTVGDGLVSQMPALIVSTAAGLLVSKAGVVGTADKAVFSQLGGYPRALGVSAAMLVALALLPGVPMLPFLMLAATTGGIALVVDRRRERKKAADAAAAVDQAAATPRPDEPISTAPHIDQLRLELGYGLLTLINHEEGHRLTDQIKALRRQIAGDMGFVMPAVRIQDNMQLPA